MSRTLNEVLLAIRQRMQQAKIEDADLEAEVLVRHALSIDRAHLYSNMGSSMGDEMVTYLYTLLRRRLENEPTAYITGHREFYGLEFAVNRDVLIPRPETETLVEAAIEIARASVESWGAPVIADIGTGSGAIAVSLAVNLPEARIYAVDRSYGALDIARKNAESHGVLDRITFLEGDLLAPLPQPVHILAANLPYVKTDDWRELPPEIRIHEPRMALDGGDDGLDLIRRLLDDAPQHLVDGGVILAEFGVGQQNFLLDYARMHYGSVTIRPDLAGRPRVLVVRREGPQPAQEPS